MTEQTRRERIGDPLLSALASQPETFWQPETRSEPVLDEALSEFAAQHREIPEAMASILRVHNGGQVRFRFLPPETVNAYGYINAQPETGPWISLFPGGLFPIANWIPLEQWLAEAGGNQTVDEFVEQSVSKDPDCEPRVFVIGQSASPKPQLTLLDLSSSYFRRVHSLCRADVNPETQRLEIVITHKSITHVFHGVFGQLRARRDELEGV